jgi:renalase
VSVVVVGAGLAGVACAKALSEAGVDVRVLERDRVCGGRMATKCYDGRRTDIGAAYFTVQDNDFSAVVDEWRSAGLAREWTDTLVVHDPDGRNTTTGPMRWAAPGGLRSLVEHLAAGLAVTTGHLVERVERGPLVNGEPADAVVLAMPGPSALRLLHPDLRQARNAVHDQVWAPALAATLQYPSRDWPDFRAAFVNDHPVLQSVCDDGSRRGDDAAVLVAHTTAAFAEHFAGDPSAAGDDIRTAVAQVFGIPQRPTTVHVHRWTFARPTEAGSRQFHLDDQRIGIAGDAWGSPRVETAWTSGTALGRELANLLRA